MNILSTILYALIIWQIFMLPVHFAGLNKKDTFAMHRIRICCWAFGWTGIGWLAGLCLALIPNKD